MSLPAQVISYVRAWKQALYSFIPALFAMVLLVLFLPAKTHAQTSYPNTPLPNQNTYAAPNTDPDVPQNQHTFVQSAMIEVMSALVCQLAGIDPINPSQPCLGTKIQSGKIGYTQSPLTQTSPQVGGLMGFVNSMIPPLYSPPVHFADYVDYLSDNFGLVQNTYAQQEEKGTSGFSQLEPLRGIWVIFRDFSYLLLVIAFVVIGLGVMLRVKIDPRTAMTIQNQIPKVIIGIILITFSFAIAGLMIDLMWMGTYFGINNLVKASKGDIHQDMATGKILSTPFSYFSETVRENPSIKTPFTQKTIFGAPVETGGPTVSQTLRQNGILNMSYLVGDSMGAVVTTSALGLLGVTPQRQECGTLDIKCGIQQDIHNLFQSIFGLLATIIAFVVIIIMLFRIWFMLIKAYIYFLIYTLVGPLWIVAGLIPGNTLGFSTWIRNLFANLAVFPAAAFLFLLARLMVTTYPKGVVGFVPPLVGNPYLGNGMGILIAFGFLLLTPELLNVLHDSLKVPQSKYSAAVTKQLGAGTSVVAAPLSGIAASSMRLDPRTQQVGWLRSIAMQKFHPLRTMHRRSQERYSNLFPEPQATTQRRDEETGEQRDRDARRGQGGTT